MGIKNINKVLKQYAPEAFFVLPIKELSGKRISIDGNSWIYSNMLIAKEKIINRTDVSLGEPEPNEIRQELFLAAINFITKWLAHDITPVFVFDGKHGPPEKAKTKSKRYEDKAQL